MVRFDIPDHPEIARAERTGCDYWEQEDEYCDEDGLYEERREAELFGEW